MINNSLRSITGRIEGLKNSIEDINKEIASIMDLGYVVVEYSSQTIRDFNTDKNFVWRMNMAQGQVLEALNGQRDLHTQEIKKLLVAIRAEALGE